MTSTAAANLDFARYSINHPDPDLRPILRFIYGPDLWRYEMLATLEALENTLAELNRVSLLFTPAKTTLSAGQG